MSVYIDYEPVSVLLCAVLEKLILCTGSILRLIKAIFVYMSANYKYYFCHIPSMKILNKAAK